MGLTTVRENNMQQYATNDTQKFGSFDRGLKSLLYGYHGKLFNNMMLFANDCQSVYGKQVIFKCFQKP